MICLLLIKKLKKKLYYLLLLKKISYFQLKLHIYIRI